MAEDSFIAADGEKLRQFTTWMKEQEERDLRNLVKRSISRDTKPERTAIRDSIRGVLPKQGGLSKWVGKMPSVRQNLTPGHEFLGVILQKRGHDVRSLNRGRLRHPIFGNRRRWAQQSIASGWWERAIATQGPIIRNKINHDIAQGMQAAYRRGMGSNG